METICKERQWNILNIISVNVWLQIIAYMVKDIIIQANNLLLTSQEAYKTPLDKTIVANKSVLQKITVYTISYCFTKFSLVPHITIKTRRKI